MGIDGIDILKPDPQVREGAAMPVIRYFIVEQVRQTKISCNTPEQAAAIGTRLFDGNVFVAEPNASVVSPVRVTALSVTEDK